ncbi:epidermal growth factor receptor kinase substrate 8-like protein 1 [Chelonoidis abingdonii]|uniref:epidermal growth factor receptor kinase substrate 8-like protein 1 n=1 Tax=Chelonoidis abingdonii TaxID=106734 RepID=UPI003F49832C
MSSSGSEVSKSSAREIYEQRKKYSNVIMTDVSQYTVNEELESYGLAGVLRCEAVLPSPRAHSLLLLVCQEPQQTQTDAHFFQCTHIGAEPIREDINSALLDFTSGSNAQRKEALRANKEKMQNGAPPTPGGTGSRPPPPHRKVVITPSATLNETKTQTQRDAADPLDPGALRIERDVVVESSGGPEFASEIRSPMLTLEAVTLLRGCLGAQEAELWGSLGDDWTRPRVEFPGDYAAPYTLSFQSGWAPPRLGPDGQPWEDPVETQHRHELRRAQVTGVGKRTVSTLGVLNGSQLFSLSKAEFQAVSPEEGARVYSQVTIHKAMLEDFRKTSELEAVMEKRKRKLEGETEASRS